VLVSPIWAIVGYFALGAIVLASRLIAPKAKAAESVSMQREPAAANEQRELAKAA